MDTTKPYSDLQVETSNRQILKIALPISLALLVPQLGFVTNNIFLGKLGEQELGTAGITGVFYLIFALMGNGLNSGLQGLIARRAGENKPLEIGKLFNQSVWIAIFFAIAGIVITYFIAPYFLSASLHSPVVEHEAIQFLRIRIWGLPFLFLFQLGNAFLVGTNNSRFMKYAFITEALLNIFFDYALIFGHFGFAKMGFNGAAYASCAAELASVAVIFSIIFYKKMNVRFLLFRSFSFKKKLAGLVFKQSAPLVLQYLLSILAWTLFYILIEHHGERPLAISNSMRSIFGIFGIFVWAFASTSNAMVSNIIGQQKQEHVIHLIKKIMTLSFLFTGTLCLLLNVFPGAFLRLYSNDDLFISDAIPVLRMVSMGVLGMSIATVWLNAVTGTGDTRVNLGIEIVTIIVYSIYVWLALSVWNFSLIVAWASELIYWGSIFSLSFLYIRSKRWMKDL